MEIKKITEAILVGGVLAVSMTASMNANAAVVAIASAATAQSQNVPVASLAFLQQAANITLSANTALAYDGDTTAAGVQAMNSKGMLTFGGSTAGGAVKACAPGTSMAFAAPSTATISTGC